MKNSKLELLASLVTSSQQAFGKLNDPLGQKGEIVLNDIMDNLKEMKQLTPLIESDLAALSSL